jgi:hypothetical protein
MAENLGRELSWDDQIENDSTFTLLPDGDYEFEVVDFERARHQGSDNLPPCNKAIVHIKIDGKEKGRTTIKHNLYLHSTTEGLLCAFFVALGLRKHGEKVAMPWNKIIGCKGRAKVGIRKYKDKNGDEQEINEIKRFYDPGEKGFTAGKF